eukprot:TRINITY_DN5437_c0_g1_i1.p1 TRINITY_DN5437_c0_g1~~TRINITY_DN5437_c0_g1_i1.p1  ORF type:complete len:295 (+),score=38.07 TRINITY_DN5437_c0_g1_i1:902-1786(+)
MSEIKEPPNKRRRLEPDRNKLHPILSDEEMRGCILTPAWSLQTKNPKLIATTIKSVSSKYPSSNISHLKRVNKVKCTEDGTDWHQVLIGFEEEFTSDIKESDYPEFSLTKVMVPKYPPLNKVQLNEWMNHWPTTLKIQEESTPNVDIFNDKDIASIKNLIELANKMAEEGSRTGNRAVGCVIARDDWKVVAESHDQTKSVNVLKHASMSCIDIVSQKFLKGDSIFRTDDYLCTGYRVVLTEEPCIMCSMALLHSRVSMVIYVKSNPERGGLGSRQKIHCQKSLNHHFHVYQWTE